MFNKDFPEEVIIYYEMLLDDFINNSTDHTKAREYYNSLPKETQTFIDNDILSCDEGDDYD